MQTKTITAIACAAILGATTALGQDGKAKLEDRSSPAGLETYTDIAIVQQNARRVIEAMSKATLDGDPSVSNKDDSKCTSQEVRSFNRGFVLATSGFNMFLALQESGFTDLSGANGLTPYKHRRFVQFGRSALLAAWTPKQLGRLFEVRETLRALPASTKADLAAFLTKLREFRVHYERLKSAKPDVLEDLFRREDDAYFWYRASVEEAASKAPENFAEQLKEMPPALTYYELSAALDKQLREASDVSKTDPDMCFVEHLGLVISYPSEKLKREYNPVFATKYLVSFWRRRDMEGITAFADFAIERVLDVLSAK